MKKQLLILCTTVTLPLFAGAATQHKEHSQHTELQVGDNVIQAQRLTLEKSSKGKGFGPQSPRDIDQLTGSNQRLFTPAPAYTKMNLCNIHFHENAEHKGGEFTKYAGNGDGHGYGSGYKYSGKLTVSELTAAEVGVSKHGSLVPGDTIEVHYVHSTAQVKPGPTLASCLSDAIANPQLRVETQVYVLVNDKKALNFVELTQYAEKGGYQQALNIPSNSGTAIEYAGSTTGPSYNETASPYQVTWNVRPKVLKVDINSVGTWLQDNVFNEEHAHAVRNLVINPELLSAAK